MELVQHWLIFFIHSQGKASNTADLDDDDSANQTKAGKGKRKPAYAGGLVLEPKKGELLPITGCTILST